MPALHPEARDLPGLPMNEVEISSISKKYESFRLRDKIREKYLLQSILEHGVREPLQCVQGEENECPYVLLDGFKRLRCCCKLHLHVVPVVCVLSASVRRFESFLSDDSGQARSLFWLGG